MTSPAPDDPDAPVVRVAVVQQRAPRPDAAAAEAVDHLEHAARAGAHVAVLPELWSNGGRPPRPGAAVADAEPFLHRVRDAAARLGLAVAVGYLGTRPDGGLTDSAVLFDSHGHPVLHYDKVHLARFAGEGTMVPGDRFPVADLGLRGGTTVRTGILICYDRVFPEAGRALAARGAELVLVPNGGPLCANRRMQVRTRSFENQYAVAVANYPDPPMGGHSLVCDGMAFGPDGHPRDLLCWQGDERPCTKVVALPVGALRRYRTAQPWGLDDRVPSAYRDDP